MYRHKRIYQIDRRTFLKGLGSTMVTLPMFDFLLNNNGTAFAQTGAGLPKRYLVIEHGLSPAWDGDNTLDSNNNYRNLLNPTVYGANYQLPGSLQSLSTYQGLQNYLGIYSNLFLPYSAGGDGSAPAGGYNGHFHEVANYAQLTGRRAQGENNNNRARGPSSDQLLKQNLNADNKFIHLNYSTQVKTYVGTGTDRFIMQYDNNGNYIEPTKSPRAAFQQLFSNFSGGANNNNPANQQAQVLLNDKRKSILDLIEKDRLQFLNRELSSKEKTMLSDHFDKIRDLETRIVAIDPTTMSNSCVKPNDPGADPAQGSDYVGDVASSGYSNEDKRADVFIDMIAMALTCDIARQGTFRLTDGQSFMNSFPFSGVAIDCHQLTHYNTKSTTQNDNIKLLNWVTSKYFKLGARLQATAEGAFNVLDNSALVFICEGGHGVNSDTMQFTSISAHSGDNMTSMILGKAGGIKTGAHVNMNKAHPTRVILSAMKAVGYSGTSLGDLNQTLPTVWA